MSAQKLTAFEQAVMAGVADKAGLAASLLDGKTLKEKVLGKL